MDGHGVPGHEVNISLEAEAERPAHGLKLGNTKTAQFGTAEPQIRDSEGDVRFLRIERLFGQESERDGRPAKGAVIGSGGPANEDK